MALAGGQYSYRITDEAARININSAPPARLDRLLQLLDIDKQERDVIVDSIQDWRDDNEEHRLSGAESDDHYLTLPVPYRARNANIESINELLQIKGITPALFHGTPERPGLADLVTVVGEGQVNININTASKLVLSATGPVRGRDPRDPGHAPRGALHHVPGRFSARGLIAATRTYRIEAIGIIDGKPRARLTAIVEVGDDRQPEHAHPELVGDPLNRLRRALQNSPRANVELPVECLGTGS